MSIGSGWNYGRKENWETDFLIGVLPKAYADNSHVTFTLKQNYIPWNIPCYKGFAIEPFTCGMYISFITGEHFWVREPDRYPEGKYYGFTSRVRAFAYVGQRFVYHLKKERVLQSVAFYYELSACDLDIIAKSGNKTLDLSDIVKLSFGVKLQLQK